MIYGLNEMDLLERICEKEGVEVSLHPKPMEGDWNGNWMSY